MRLSDATLAAVASRFGVLSAASRLKILNVLMDGPASMGDLSEATGLSQSNLSRQVVTLESAGCVRRFRNGRGVGVEIVDPGLRPLCELVCGSLQEAAERRLSALGRV